MYGLGGGAPESQGAVPGDIAKVSVGRQHREVVADTELRQKRIDRAGLNAAASTFVLHLELAASALRISEIRDASGRTKEQSPPFEVGHRRSANGRKGAWPIIAFDSKERQLWGTLTRSRRLG
jgi:hypothetical protein